MNHRIIEWCESAARVLPDKQYISLKYYFKTGERIDWDKPETFNEKLQWLKLHDRNPKYTSIVDKIEAKKYALSKINESHIVPTIAIWDNIDDINWEVLPERFVIKTNHDSGGVVICDDKKNLDIEQAKKKLKQHLNSNYYLYGREWPYKNVRRKIFAEEFLSSDSTTGINDYKVFVFNGKPRIIQVDFDRFLDHKRNIYDTNWNYVECELEYPTHPEISIDKPHNLTKMLEMASELAADIPFARVDFYEVDKHLYFGEITLYPGSGFEVFKPYEWNKEIGTWLKIMPEY